MKLTVLTLSACFLFFTHADEMPPQSVRSARTQEPFLPLHNVVTDIPATAWLGLKNSFRQDALPGWALILGTSAVLYKYDEDILNGIQKDGRDWKLGNSVNYKSALNIGNLTVLSLPRDTAGWLYFMGDGLIPVTVSVSMLGLGYANSNGRLYNTGIEMADGLLTGAIFDQMIKHITGRESPSAHTEARGAWHPMTSFKTYRSNTAKYDAMPSGHIMTATVMSTVIEQNYPEYNDYMYPFEAVWLGVLGFGMINVGVHWASDYPLGIALGYVFGKAAVDLHRQNVGDKVGESAADGHRRRLAQSAKWRFLPGLDTSTGQTTLNALRGF